MRMTNILSSAFMLIAAAWHAAGQRQNPGKVLTIESPQRFCLLLPPVIGMDIGVSEGQAVSYCTGGISTLGSRQLPAGAVVSAHVVKTPFMIQITGTLGPMLDLENDAGGGGQYDDASWGIEPLSSCLGYSRYVQLVGGSPEFCVRCCQYEDADWQDYNRTAYCFAGNDREGCHYVIPGNYGPGFSVSFQTDMTGLLPPPRKTLTTSATAVATTTRR
ncbi:hypothetical protein BC829DRAFT_388628 [Chytridium lagenaria]|nr:hypothetical protein BC829DRAFT_388628 [Chytridium lagenaria]